MQNNSIKDKKEKISPRVIERLTIYRRFLENLSDDSYISSENMAEKLELTAAQIRKDLSNFISSFGEGFGVRGKGYNVKILKEGIEKILGVNKINNVILIGAGRLGEALLSEPEFTKKSFNIVGVFDSNKKIIGKEIGSLEVQDVKELVTFLKKNKGIDIAILTVPKEAVQGLINEGSQYGVEAFLNFAPVKVEVPQGVAVQNIDLYAKLQELNYWRVN